MKILRNLLLISAVFSGGNHLYSQTKDTLTVMFYNLLNFPTATATPNRQDTLRKIVGYVKPDIFICCEVNNGGANPMLNGAFNVFGYTGYSMAPFVTNQSTTDDHQQMCYYRNTLLGLKSQSQILTDLRDVNQYILYYKDPNLATTHDTTWVDMYCTHLKAGSTASDSLRRITEVTNLRTYLNSRPAGRNNILGADFNVYTSNENCYQILTASGTYPFRDPINRPGTWNNNGTFADIHTQSTRTVTLNGGATGGLDDRFDQILTSANVLTGANRVRYLPGTYKALGNDGLHFNQSLLAAPTVTIVPDSVRRALYYMADHLPVVMQIEVTLPTLLASEISRFEAEVVSGGVLLDWRLEQGGAETVEVERSVDGEHFVRIHGQAAAHGMQYLDPAPLHPRSYYRLRLTDADGAGDRYSSVRTVRTGQAIEFTCQNPASGQLNLSWVAETEILPVLQLTDMTGRVVLEWKGDPAVANDAEIMLGELPAGVYSLQFHDAATGQRAAPVRLLISR